jgi:hypothetical protein
MSDVESWHAGSCFRAIAASRGDRTVERTSPDDDSTNPSAVDAAGDPKRKPRDPPAPAGSSDVRPETQSSKAKAIPLDEGKKIEQGIEVKEI